MDIQSQKWKLHWIDTIIFIALLFFSLSAFAAQPVYIKLEIDGNQISGESDITSLDRADSIVAYSFGFNAYVPGDFHSAGGAATGQPDIRPITFVKRIDKSTPLIFQALVTNQTVNSLEARFFRPNPTTGTEEHYYTVLLQNARIVGINQVNDYTPELNQLNYTGTELITVAFQEMTLTYEVGGVEYHYIWGQAQ